MMRHSIALLVFAVYLPALLASPQARATEVALIGTFDTKAAILSINGGAPRTVRVGQTVSGVTIVSVENDRATVEVEGKRRLLVRGQTYSSGRASGAQSVTLAVGAGGLAAVYVVTLDSVRVGGIELQNVEAIVIEQGLTVALLGNSFLSRTEMRREGQTMTLTWRF